MRLPKNFQRSRERLRVDKTMAHRTLNLVKKAANSNRHTKKMAQKSKALYNRCCRYKLRARDLQLELIFSNNP
jgi:hypothetical protein